MPTGDAPESGLRIRDLRKSYADVSVLRGVDLRTGSGQVHALLGPNGAGKSTLIKCLSGGTTPTSGEIHLDGEALVELTPRRAAAAGVAVVHQHLSLVDTLSVTDNLFLGQEDVRFGLTRRRAQQREARALLDRFGIDVDERDTVGNLPMGVKQLIEIAKAWHRSEVKLLILDEPTASLSEAETNRLFAEVTRLRDAGATIIYTTHRLPEVFEIADAVTVLRDGVVVLSGGVRALSTDELVSAISAGGVRSERRVSRSTGENVMLEGQALEGRNFGPIDFAVHAGEIVGLYGVLGSGRTSILETIAGRFPTTGGSLSLAAHHVRANGPRARISDGVMLVPADRARQALWSELDAASNILLPSMSRLARYGLRSSKRERREFHRLAEQVDLQPLAFSRPGGQFSGGNQQKLVIARWLGRSRELRVLLLDELTQGVDVGARRKIYETLYALAAEGVAVLFASTDAAEVALVADRALVIDRGVVRGELADDELTEENLIRQTHQFVGATQ